MAFCVFFFLRDSLLCLPQVLFPVKMAYVLCAMACRWICKSAGRCQHGVRIRNDLFCLHSGICLHIEAQLLGTKTNPKQEYQII